MFCRYCRSYINSIVNEPPSSMTPPTPRFRRQSCDEGWMRIHLFERKTDPVLLHARAGWCKLDPSYLSTSICSDSEARRGFQLHTHRRFQLRASLSTRSKPSSGLCMPIMNATAEITGLAERDPLIEGSGCWDIVHIYIYACMHVCMNV